MCAVGDSCGCWSLKTCVIIGLGFFAVCYIARICLTFHGIHFDIPILLWTHLELSAVIMAFYGISDNEPPLFLPHLVLQSVNFVLHVGVLIEAIITGESMLIPEFKYCGKDDTLCHDVIKLILASLTILTGYFLCVVYHYRNRLQENLRSGVCRRLIYA